MNSSPLHSKAKEDENGLVYSDQKQLNTDCIWLFFHT